MDDDQKAQVKAIDEEYQRTLQQIRDEIAMTEDERVAMVATKDPRDIYNLVIGVVNKIDLYRTARDAGDPLADISFLQAARVDLLKIVGVTP